MSKEKECKCCKRIWYEDMLDKKFELCPNCYEYCKPLIDDLKIKDQSKKIANLEAKLAESEKKAYSRGHSQRDIANEIKLNALREDVANKEKRIVELKQQLAECEEKKESYRLQNEQHHLQLLQFYSRLGVEAFGADIHEKALETLMIMKEQLAEKEKEISEYIKIVDDLHKQLSDKCDFCDKTKDQDKISFAVEQLEKLKVELHIIHTNGYLKAIDEEIDNQINGLKGGE